MSAFRLVDGFEDVWRPVALPRRTAVAILRPDRGRDGVRARLVRVVQRAPEVMVKVTGRTTDAGHLRAHLDYISRNGDVPLEDRDGAILSRRGEVAELAEDWSAMALLDSRRRASTPFSLSIVLSMPERTDPAAVRDAARAFALAVFADKFDYVFALHTDTPRPHVHLAVRTFGEAGARLNPKKADLEAWRQVFARALRDRGIEAEATPRRARGVTRKAERTPLRKIRERSEAGLGGASQVLRTAYREAARAAFQGLAQPAPWETRLLACQARIRGLYLAQARMLQSSTVLADRALGRKVEAFVHAMPRPDSQRLALARELRDANTRLELLRNSERPARDR